MPCVRTSGALTRVEAADEDSKAGIPNALLEACSEACPRAVQMRGIGTGMMLGGCEEEYKTAGTFQVRIRRIPFETLSYNCQSAIIHENALIPIRLDTILACPIFVHVRLYL
jgi:hypothetical protein